MLAFAHVLYDASYLGAFHVESEIDSVREEDTDVSIGRGPPCNVALPDPGVSEKYDALEMRGNFSVICKNSSVNGIAANDHVVSLDMRRLGKFVLRLEACADLRTAASKNGVNRR